MKAYEEWTYDIVRARIVEAAETLIAHPSVVGPRMASGAMAEEIARAADTYGADRPRSRRILSPGSITRMEETWRWINTWLDEENRKLVYDYGFIKTRKGQFLDAYLKRNDLVRRTFERKINKACQHIANNLNRLLSVRLTVPGLQVSQNQSVIASSNVTSDKHVNYWRDVDAKPQINPDLAPVRTIEHRIAGR